MTHRITRVAARRILDCRGLPTLQLEVWAGAVYGRADVPAGRSTDSREASQLRDGGSRYRGRDVNAVYAGRDFKGEAARPVGRQ